MAPAENITNKVFIPAFFAVFLITVTANAGPNWINHGGDLRNRRYAEGEVKISPKTVSKLQLKWKFFAGKDITATPAIFDGVLYFPSWNGNVYAVRAKDGSLVWEKNLSELTGLNATGLIANTNSTVARATPTIAGDLLIVGIYGPAVVIAMERANGKLVWLTKVDDHPLALITMSGTAYNGLLFLVPPHILHLMELSLHSPVIPTAGLNIASNYSFDSLHILLGFYVGTSSFEEGASVQDCCVFRGSLAKLDIRTGAIIWKTHVLPDNGGKPGGYAGAAIWGSSPSIDKPRNLVFAATGNLYSAPQRVLDCQRRANNQTTRPDECIEDVNHGNSILAFDLDSGKIRWFRQLGGYDVYFEDCSNVSKPGCPPGPNPDADFGEAPMMLSVRGKSGVRDVVVAVQKSGIAWALDRGDGKIVWYTKAGPGGIAGGGTWGAATDGKRVYTNIANSNGISFKLTPSNINTTAGAWVAMDAATGKIIWSIANPRYFPSNAPVTVANGVLFAGSPDPLGAFFAMDASTGRILWSYNTNATIYGGASISHGCVYLGNGYKVNLGASFPIVTAGTSLFAFCAP
ncbi:hypothetical protein Sjap_023852 [Stephania japonica]|uniref:Pyrrolo-quinoline quinone repeat domain-containing protein n=1 Tax=Stephania japonica TaxID=461633 RepID=A0AAP0HPL7_9MAGN